MYSKEAPVPTERVPILPATVSRGQVPLRAITGVRLPAEVLRSQGFPQAVPRAVAVALTVVRAAPAAAVAPAEVVAHTVPVAAAAVHLVQVAAAAAPQAAARAGLPDHPAQDAKMSITAGILLRSWLFHFSNKYSYEKDFIYSPFTHMFSHNTESPE